MWIRASLAQLVEHALRKRKVMGSTPHRRLCWKVPEKAQEVGKGDGTMLGAVGI